MIVEHYYDTRIKEDKIKNGLINGQRHNSKNAFVKALKSYECIYKHFYPFYFMIEEYNNTKKDNRSILMFQNVS